jgi:hypothetical protein
MPLPKDIPTVIDELDRLQKITPQRLDRLEHKTALILRSVGQVGLVSNSTIAQLDRVEKEDIFSKLERLDERLVWGLMILLGLVIMVVTFLVTDFILSALVKYFHWR